MPGTSIKVRPATAADCPLILEFIQELADYEKLSNEVCGSAERLEHDLFGPSPTAEVRIAEADGKPAGFALFFTNYSTFLTQPGIYLEDLFVRPQFRGQGAGLRLLAEVASEVVRRGYGRLDWSVLDWNEPAIGFYETLGAGAQRDWIPFRMTGATLEALARRAG